MHFNFTHSRGESQSALNKNWVFNALLCCAIYPSCSLLALYKKYKILNRKDPVDTRNSGTLNFQIKILPIFHQLYFCQNKLSLPDTAPFAAMSHGYASAVWLHALSSVPVRITRREKHSVLTITDLEWFCSMDYNLSLKEQKKKKWDGGAKEMWGWGPVAESWIICSWRQMSAHHQDWSQACLVIFFFPWHGCHPYTGDSNLMKFWSFPLHLHFKGIRIYSQVSEDRLASVSDEGTKSSS